MATGDTIPGVVKAVREINNGDTERTLGPISANDMDTKDNAEERLYVNTNRTRLATKPSGVQGKTRDAPKMEYGPGEKIAFEHRASSTVANDIDLDANEFFIDVVERDLNRGVSNPEQLTQADQELSGTVSESTSDYVRFFEYTVPDRTKIFVAGGVSVAAVES